MVALAAVWVFLGRLPRAVEPQVDANAGEETQEHVSERASLSDPRASSEPERQPVPDSTAGTAAVEAGVAAASLWRITDPSGRGVGGLAVEVSSLGRNDHPQPAKSNPQGEFKVELPIGARVQCDIVSPGWALMEPDAIVVNQDFVHLVATQTGQLLVELSTTDHATSNRFTVSAKSLGRNGRTVEGQGNDGVARLELAPGTYFAAVALHGAAATPVIESGVQRAITIEAGHESRMTILAEDVDWPALTVVSQATGQPLAGVEARMLTSAGSAVEGLPPFRSGPDGTIALRLTKCVAPKGAVGRDAPRLELLPVWLQITHPEYETDRVYCPIGRRAATLRLRPVGDTVALTVRSRQFGNSSATVVLHPFDPLGSAGNRRAPAVVMEFPPGCGEVSREVGTGAYRLRAFMAEQPGIADERILVVDGTQRQVVVDLAAEAATETVVRFEVLASELRGRRAVLRASRDGNAASSSSGLELGSTARVHLPKAQGWTWVLNGDFGVGASMAPVRVAVEDRDEVVLRLPAGRLEVHCTDSAGAPLPWAALSLVRTGIERIDGVTDDLGVCKFFALEDGTYTVMSPSRPLGWSAVVTIDTTAMAAGTGQSDSAVVQLQFGPALGAVAGKIELTSTDTVPPMVITLARLPGDGDQGSASSHAAQYAVDADGRFAFENVQTGVYLLSPMWYDIPPAEGRVVLPSPVRVTLRAGERLEDLVLLAR